MRRIGVVIGISVLAGVAGAAMPREYDVLRRKSIFSRERVWSPSTQPVTRSSSTSTSSYVLVGILRRDDAFEALLEAPGGGRATPVTAGQSLPGGGGTVTAITLDFMEFVPAPDAAPRRVLLGRSLDGAESTLAAATQPASADTPVEGEDIISRMKRRRQQESAK